MSAVKPSPGAAAARNPARAMPGSGAGGVLSIRRKHVECIERMLNFNMAVDSKTNWQEHWKLLVYDDFCRDVISVLFKVADLRKLGVTLHLNLHSERQAVQDVTAIYLVEAAKSNVERIARDCSAGLYDSVHLNWSSSISQDLLHSLASSVAEAPNAASRVSKVFDQYLNFISLGHNLFHLNQPDSYIALNDPEVSDSDMERTISEIVNGLFSVAVTLSVLPIICCPRGDAAGMVGERLHKRLYEHVRSTNNLFKDKAFASSSHSRPVLLLLDRSTDLSVNLQHAWTYEALLHDVLGLRLNKVTVVDPDAGAQAAAKRAKVYDLGGNDAFWVDNCGQPFPKVTDDIEERLGAWKREYDAIAPDSASAGQQEAGGIDALTRAAQLVPELTERKRLLDMHTNICTVLLSHIKERELDNLFSLESAIVSGTVYNAKSALLQVLSQEALGTGEDKLRLFVIYYLCNPSLSEAEVKEYEDALSQLGVDLSLCAYLKYLKKMRALTSRAAALGTGGGDKSSRGLSLTDIMSKAQAGRELASGLLKSVQASIGGKKITPVLRVVDAVMENKGAGGVTDDYQFLDPNLAGPLPNDARKPFREAVVFSVGSGNYVEYQDLQDYAARTSKNIIYGTTELVTAAEFLRQLSVLGAKKFSTI